MHNYYALRTADDFFKAVHEESLSSGSLPTRQVQRSTRPWVLGFFHEDLGFFIGFLKSSWVFLGIFHISGENIFFLWFLPKSKELLNDFLAKCRVVGEY